MNTIVIELNDEQFHALAPMFIHLNANNGSIIAQVYQDGIRCKWLTDGESESVMAALKTPRGFRAYAFGDSEKE